MVNPLSIKCPHCEASFKIKSKSAFGKKVKCPKCETPFVIPEPASIRSSAKKKKSKPSSLADEFFDDESESTSSLFDDDFDDWEEDLSGGPAARPKPKKTSSKPKQKKQKSTSDFSISDYGFSPFLTGLAVFLILSNLILAVLGHHLATLAQLASLLIGIIYIAVGNLGILYVAARESALQLIICLFVPFYSYFYAIISYEYTKTHVMNFLMGLVLCLGTIFFGTNSSVGLFKNRHSNNIAAAPEPDIGDHFNQRNAANENPFNSDPNPLNRRSTSSSPKTPTYNFDLNRVDPMPMTWRERGVSGSGVYTQKKTSSAGTVYEVLRMKNTNGKEIAGSTMHFRVYLPPGHDPASPVPCVLIPPAGSNLLSGMAIDPHDLIPNPEHEPYVKAGFAVVTFSIDGDLWNRENSTNTQYRIAFDQFKISQAGMANCLHAFIEAHSVIPGIDKENIFIAGHSSAGTLALLFAEHYPKIKGCLAYAPSVDLQKSFADHLADIKPILPDVESFIRLSSPQTHIKKLKCPVFLFHSPQDPVTSFENAHKFATALTVQGTPVEFVISKGADHYQPMIDEGIPKGIAWIKKIVAQSAESKPDSKMAATETDKPVNKTVLPGMDLTRRTATFQILEFPKFYSKIFEDDKQENSKQFWKESLESKSQNSLKDIVTGYKEGTEKIDLENMTFRFDFVGTLPENFSSQFVEAFFTEDFKLSTKPTSVEEYVYDPEAGMRGTSPLTFHIRNLNRIRFNRITSPKIAEAELRQIERYVPDSLKINMTQEWIYLSVKGTEGLDELTSPVERALNQAGFFVSEQKMVLTEADLNSSDTYSVAGDSSSATKVKSPAGPDEKLKYIILYGVYGGDDLKESVQRSLKGFVWVDPKSIQFNPNKKEISFKNRSTVDTGALERALTRNKFYQLDISYEALPAESPEPTSKEKTAAE
ncbi:prolyl oligopeptidase family serine peptidase [Gimesia sp.]|uniref:prolyl oligopeptidase family serine peptidase n=1 Tax=Gimesia sp. TaxID=2024833 RepID=UPI000C4F395C|nr:prolyl oligopeptidase family serine peptidase [Gimesia sp.]MAX38351.1 hypothetical protein [Gimesia sp.]HAH47609.1 hypothetical protein [Planctomycetaceae bacterium]|tara:strand:- start:31232 stop:34027 length:2796 start_codon:yes stop_codon:yes gene_type:complete